MNAVAALEPQIATAQIVVLRNPFDRRERDVHAVPVGAQTTVAALIERYVPAGAAVHASIGGLALTEQDRETRILAAGEGLLIVPRVTGDDFNPLNAILSIAVMVAAGPAAYALYGAAGGTMAAGAFAASAGGMIMSAGIGACGELAIARIPQHVEGVSA